MKNIFRHEQQGQALVEVVLALLLVLIPLFIFNWSLNAHSQARTTALSAARYAAWERTVWLDTGKGADVPASAYKATRDAKTIEGLMVERFFAQPDAQIVSRVEAQNTKNDKRASFYELHNGDNLLELEKTGNTGKGQGARPTLSLYETGEVTSGIGKAYNAVAGAIAGLSGKKVELETRGLYVADVSVKLNAVRGVKLLEDLDLTYNQRAAVLTNGWSLAGSEHEIARVKPMVSTSMIGDFMENYGINDMLAVLGNATPFKELDVGHVEPDIVPDSDTIIKK
ncbi:hypothetical protein AGMMS49545_02900 [Betaproteobacteria bacterium]|nr:hypothetical protein AGMMS49545_02900 [Betaproteobacteria bacterium]GHU47434.1 hypothetical protein AGMMS50289_22620 [Betaproteobacteria bacterium]